MDLHSVTGDFFDKDLLYKEVGLGLRLRFGVEMYRGQQAMTKTKAVAMLKHKKKQPACTTSCRCAC